MKLTTIASGSSGNCYLLQSHGDSLLIEAGLPQSRLKPAIWALGVRLSNCKGCLISHSHGDHAKSVRELLSKNMHVGMSQECANALGLTKAIFAGALKILEPEKETHFVSYSVTPFEVRHDHEGTLGFAIDHICGGRLAYVTDARFVGYKIPGVTQWAIEANYDVEILKRNVAKGSIDETVAKRVLETHMSIDTAINALKANDLSACEKITLIHLSNGNSDPVEFKRRVIEATGIPTFIAGASA